MRWPSLDTERGGFALTMAILAVVIIAALASGGLYVATQQLRAGSAGSRAGAAFYAAEAGLSVALTNWNATAVDSLAPGATVLTAFGRLVSGGGYEVRVTRLDSGQNAGAAYYLAVSTGRAQGAWGGRRQVALLLRASPIDDLCCGAALTTRGELQVADGGAIRGIDLVPRSWAADSMICAAAVPGGRPAVVTDDAHLLRVEPSGVVDGHPPVVEWPSLEAGFQAEMERLFQKGAELADIAYAGDERLSEIQPRVDPHGNCARSVIANWGAPRLPGHLCFDYFPIVFATGDLLIESPGSGQGVLLVDGDLTLKGGFEFYGLLIVRGRLVLADEGTWLYGGAWVHNEDGERNLVGPGAGISYSHCAIRRAVQGSKLQVPHPLAQFAWLEILE